jgi:predicted nucleotidyltransferase
VARVLGREELLSLLRSALPVLQDRYGVRTLGLFGSYVRGEARASSDVDLLVGFSRTPSLFQLIELEQHLTDLLGVSVDKAWYHWWEIGGLTQFVGLRK